MRYSVEKSIKKFNKIFHLQEPPFCQDWYLECADKFKLPAFIDGYTKYCEDDDDRFTLMTIILGSYEMYVEEEGHSPEIWGKIAGILQKNKELHKDTISYWCLWDEDDPDNWLVLTGYMRGI
ncbi:MAG: hypothetical protein JXB88_15535 [Spirochaetales bacterium]|nr:hypothetical protein [Spirochaetales bacterium]